MTKSVMPKDPPKDGVSCKSKIIPVDLPPPDTKRWVPRSKATIVNAVHSGAMSPEEVCRRYELSVEESVIWQRAIETHGVAGLRVTRTQIYRGAPPARPAHPRSAEMSTYARSRDTRSPIDKPVGQGRQSEPYLEGRQLRQCAPGAADVGREDEPSSPSSKTVLKLNGHPALSSIFTKTELAGGRQCHPDIFSSGGCSVDQIGPTGEVISRCSGLCEALHNSLKFLRILAEMYCAQPWRAYQYSHVNRSTD
jgi:hypothetical protein